MDKEDKEREEEEGWVDLITNENIFLNLIKRGKKEPFFSRMF